MCKEESAIAATAIILCLALKWTFSMFEWVVNAKKQKGESFILGLLIRTMSQNLPYCAVLGKENTYVITLYAAYFKQVNVVCMCVNVCICMQNLCFGKFGAYFDGLISALWNISKTIWTWKHADIFSISTSLQVILTVGRCR